VAVADVQEDLVGARVLGQELLVHHEGGVVLAVLEEGVAFLEDLEGGLVLNDAGPFGLLFQLDGHLGVLVELGGGDALCQGQVALGVDGDVPVARPDAHEHEFALLIGRRLEGAAAGLGEDGRHLGPHDGFVGRVYDDPVHSGRAPPGLAHSQPGGEKNDRGAGRELG
jgi:hypothetical protein